MDGWTKRGMLSSFLGISACFFDTTENGPKHALLNLHQLQHPHTGEMLAQCLTSTLQQWKISRDKLLVVVSDNGANIVKDCEGGEVDEFGD